MKSGARRLTIAILPAPVLGLWFLAKSGLFRGLEYTADIITLTQASRGWLLGWPLLRENRFGETLVHNYFLSLPLGLLTLLWGAYGLFMAHAALLYLACLGLLRHPRHVSSAARRLALTLVFLLGPVGFWLWDDPIYGWHLELLFVPLSILFADALARGSRAAWLWAALLVLLREDGAIQGCCVHLLIAWTDGRMASPMGRRLRTAIRIGLSWGIVFAGDLLLQHWLQPAATDRLSAALRTLGSVAGHPVLLRSLLSGVGGALLLLAAGALLASPGARLWTAAAATPLMAANVVSSAAYAFNVTALEIHGPLWPARFAMLWGLVGASLVVEPRSPPPRRRWWTSIWSRVAISALLQLVLLATWRDYAPIARARAGLGGTGVAADVLTSEERTFLECVPTVLPTHTSIASHSALFAYFHQHDVVWPGFDENAWRPPAIVVCETGGRFRHEAACSRLLADRAGAGFGSLAVGNVATAFEPVLERAIRSCPGSKVPADPSARRSRAE